MPHVIVKLYSGRSEQQKADLADEVAKAVVSALTCGEAAVSVAIEDVESQDWAETVYKPDILDKPGTIYRKPGYNPFEGA
jgi:4-oxalocrotonate tautomerase